MISGLARIDWRRFLDRPRLPLASPSILDRVREERILVTGAGGSIGSSLALRLASLIPRSLVLLDVSAHRLAALEKLIAALAPNSPVAFVLGNVADLTVIDKVYASHAPTLILHAAAEKHVAPLEERPFAAVESNVFGTAAVISLAAGARVLLLSTDKAVNPRSVMGATKRIAEELVRSSGGSALRLGNVLATRDSVVEVFARQLESGQALTITTPAARRYFLTIDEAVDLLLAASLTGERASLFIPDLDRQYFITDLAGFLAEQLAAGRTSGIEFTQLGPGDKESEELRSAGENPGIADRHGLVSIVAPSWSARDAERALASLRAAWGSGDPGALVAVLQEIVPSYTPSRAVLCLAQEDSPRVAS